MQSLQHRSWMPKACMLHPVLLICMHMFFLVQNPIIISAMVWSAVVPDGFTFRVGVTTVADAGGAGWKSFPTFKKNIIDNSQTRVLVFLNIVGEGMRGGAYEQNVNDMDAKLSAFVAKQYKDYIVGFKVAHFVGAEWTPVDRAVEAGKLANMPVMVDFGASTPPLSIEELYMKHLRPGDIYTHTYTLLEGNVRETVVDTVTNKVKPFIWDALKKELFSMLVMGVPVSISHRLFRRSNKAFFQKLSAPICIQAA